MPAPALVVLLARNLVEHLDLPGLIVAANGDLTFFNEAAGELVGERFARRLSRQEWNQVGPRGADGSLLPSQNLPLSRTLREGRAAHGRFFIVNDSDDLVEVDTTAMPLRDADGFHGAMVLFWRVDET